MITDLGLEATANHTESSATDVFRAELCDLDGFDMSRRYRYPKQMQAYDSTLSVDRGHQLHLPENVRGLAAPSGR